MSHQSPFAGQESKGFPFLRKKRTIFVVVTGLITLFFFLRSSAFSPAATAEFNDIYGLLYMVSRTENLLPHELGVDVPVTPKTWVPQETFNQRVWKERIEQLDKDTPVVVFSKSYCPYSRRAKELLARYALEPAPRIIEVDLRDDSDAIKRVLYRLTGRSTFPNVILQGKSLGGYDNLHDLHGAGDLEYELKKAGVGITGNTHDE